VGGYSESPYPKSQIMFPYCRKWNEIPSQIVKPPLDQKALLAQEQVIYLQDFYKTPEAFYKTL
jgi:hypothetical protein